MARKLLLHVLGPGLDSMEGPLRVAQNARTALGPDVVVEIVVQGALVRLLGRDATGSAEITDLLDKGDAFKVLACANSMASVQMTEKDLLGGVGIVPSAVAYLAQEQFDGAAYVRF